jgi:hypothetical protein
MDDMNIQPHFQPQRSSLATFKSSLITHTAVSIDTSHLFIASLYPCKMSFGFGVSDFLAVGQLVLRLYNACDGAPEGFQELRRDLSSIHIVLSGLELQVADPSSLFRQRCGDRKPEWMQLRTNLEATLEELENLVQASGGKIGCLVGAGRKLR